MDDLLLIPLACLLLGAALGYLCGKSQKRAISSAGAGAFLIFLFAYNWPAASDAFGSLSSAIYLCLTASAMFFTFYGIPAMAGAFLLDFFRSRPA